MSINRLQRTDGPLRVPPLMLIVEGVEKVIFGYISL